MDPTACRLQFSVRQTPPTLTAVGSAQFTTHALVNADDDMHYLLPIHLYPQHELSLAALLVG
ncbi:hypothetical protein K504DRAFT_468635 [Pleomassaria siparia CBS 279.74]|uniref:Uncharacterized protein n=1 Tax=Pleomassaria siparia CBS 279.74 TaxID=1314801 RepID=A0A6G1K5X3_9PLEO|nr:hypothetical protein K504DRAFT_468635 [Pleomassaria siparia CBS 279.74]